MKNKKTRKSFSKLLLTIFIICNFFLIKNIINGLHLKFNIALTVLGLSIFLPLFINLRKKNFFLFDPKNIIALMFSAMYYFSSIPVYSAKDPRSFFISILFDPLNQDNITVFYIMSLGIIFFYIGYDLVSIITSKTRSINYTIVPAEFISLKNKFLILYLFSISFRAYGYLSGFMGSLSATGSNNLPNIPFISVFFFISNFWVIYYFYFSAISFVSKKNKNIFLFFLLFELFFMLISGDRRNILILVFTYSLAFYLVNNYLPLRKIIRYSILFLIFVFPLLTVYGFLLSRIDNFSISNLIEILKSSFTTLNNIAYLDIFNDYLLNPIIQSFNYFSNVGIAYTEFSQNGITWGAVGIENLLDKLIPSSIYSTSFDERIYYQLFSERALSYKVNYSHLTFTAQTEQMLSFGITGVLLGMFLQGVVCSYLFRIYNSITTPRILRLVYLGLLFKFTVNFCSGLLVADLVQGIRLFIYVIIAHLFYKLLKRNYA